MLPPDSNINSAGAEIEEQKFWKHLNLKYDYFLFDWNKL